MLNFTNDFVENGGFMGGYGSGREGYSLTTKLDEGLSLNISFLKREGTIALNKRCSGKLTWTIKNSDEKASTIGYECNTLDPDNMWLRLHYTLTIEDKKYGMDYKVRLITTQPNYGGKRIWFECPLTYRRTPVLHSPPEAKWFASRHAYGFQYQSQSEGVLDRANARALNLKNKLGGEKYYFKPKGMHQTTYSRLLNELYEAEILAERLYIECAMKILKRPIR